MFVLCDGTHQDEECKQRNCKNAEYNCYLREPEKIIITETTTTEYINPEWMKYKRLERGYSYRFLAKLLGVSAPYLSDVEKKNRRMTNPILINHCVTLLSCGAKIKRLK